MSWQRLFTLATSLASRLTSVDKAFCIGDEVCSLNGVCTVQGFCECDKGWYGDDCGALDIRPVQPRNGYNLTAQSNSSWGSHIVRDPHDHGLYHLFTAEFENSCGLDYWAPYSRIIRAESHNGPAGPYAFAAEIQPAFAHNPTVVYSPADRKWLMYYIGCKLENLADECSSRYFTCGPGNTMNGESGISVMSSSDLRQWHPHGPVIQGENDTRAWDADFTNPSPLPLAFNWQRLDQRRGLDADSDPDPGMLLVYRGCPYNCTGKEQINVAISKNGFKGPYVKLQTDPVFENNNEDPFVWRDKRGHYHMLLHSLELDGGFGAGPKVGRHAFARDYSGPWTFGERTLAYSTEVDFEDGRTTNYFRRERPQLYFSDDGEMTPLFLSTGVQPRNSPMSHSLIVPVGDDGVKVQSE